MRAHSRAVDSAWHGSHSLSGDEFPSPPILSPAFGVVGVALRTLHLIRRTPTLAVRAFSPARVPARVIGASAGVQQEVVRRVMANHQVLRPVVTLDFVDVMNLGTNRHGLAKRVFCYLYVYSNNPAAFGGAGSVLVVSPPIT